MITNQTTHYLADLNIDPGNIPVSNVLERSEDAIELAHSLKRGEYITLPNKNDLSEVLIYRRSNFQDQDLSILRWDGRHVDTSWFNDQSATDYQIHNAEQFAGLKELVESGYTFDGKVIHLTSNINLGGEEWNPIGEGYEIETIEDDGMDLYFRVHFSEDKSFSGTLDGGNHVIYGLKITNTNMLDNQRFTGIFRTLNNATIKNLSIEGAQIGSLDRRQIAFSTLFGYAEDSTFINIAINGSILGQEIASLGCVAINCSFVDCINRASLRALATEANGKIIVGGLVEYVGLSSKMIKKVHENKPRIFDKCVQAGVVTIDGTDACSIFGGQLYGATLYKKTGKNYGFTIDHCTIYDGSVPIIHNFDKKKTSAIIYGKLIDSKYPKNIISGISSKIDLLGGIIGKTNVNISVTVVRVTRSTKIDSLVIPGSVNTLKSQEFLNSFVTTDVSQVTSEDLISNLRPYYTFVKADKI
jgi:hypothetical protein